MVKKTIIRKPSGEIIVDPHKAKYLKDASMKNHNLSYSEINLLTAILSIAREESRTFLI